MDGDPMIDDEVGAHTRVTVLAYWKFESVSLQHGVCCEPAPLHQGARPATRSEVTGDRQAALQPAGFSPVRIALRGPRRFEQTT